MKVNALLLLLIAILAIGALVVSFVALNRAQSARELALSEIIVEEANSMSTPVYHEETNKYGYLTLYDISIANMSGPALKLDRVAKTTSGVGFLSLLKGPDLVNAQVNAKAFISEKGSAAIKNEPRLLKSIGLEDMGDAVEVGMTIAPGETKVIHLGLTLEPYTADMRAVANMALVSFELLFDNGKSYIFQRGFPIYPLQQ
ncbi:hypothetical protein EH223_09015 [candidate division KSB1 bacterium]|nr:hypothetical protein [candidate division KSB1 bacterium]RQW03747.1 MAG: hypothetical protein EH223_09015 [candidate division KSB1 bacterium]